LLHFFYIQLLKIERVSDTGLKQTCISEVSFASLVAMPESDSSLPKLSFPKENPRKKEKVCALRNRSQLVHTTCLHLNLTWMLAQEETSSQ